MKNIFTSIALLFIITHAQSQSLKINKSFGSKGISQIYAGPPNQNVTSEIIQKIFPLDNGNTLEVTTTSNYTQIIRRLENGRIDKSYGNNGVSETVKMYIGISVSATIQTDGKIVVAGLVSYDNPKIAIARFTKTGKLDATFGTAGVSVTNIGFPVDLVRAVAIDHAGRIIVLGQVSVGGQTNILLTRYTAAGVPDLSFNGLGWANYFQSYIAVVCTMTVLSDDQILAIGFTYTPSGYGLAMERFTVDGSRDFAFNGGNVVTANLLPKVAVTQPDGKILIGGLTDLNQSSLDRNFGLLRINPDGSADYGFNSGHVVSTGFGSQDNELEDLAVAASGKIVACGYATYTNDQDYTIARYNSDGSADLTFNGTGIKVIHFSDSQDIPYSVAIQNNKIITGGFSYVGNGYDFSIVRLKQNGDFDNSFGKSGKQVDNLTGATNSTVNDLQRQPDGKLLAPTIFVENNPPGSALVTVKTSIERFKTDGTVDNSFGKNGLLSINYSSIFTTFNDKLIVAGTSNGNILLSGFKNNGNPDGSFGINGTSLQDLGDGENPMVLRQQSANRFLLGGSVNSNTTNDIFLARFTANGQLDDLFGVHGKVVLDFAGSYEYITDITIQPDGKILVTGSYSDINYLTNIFVTRLSKQGVLDPSFGNNGVFTFQQAPYNEGLNLAIAPSGKIFVTCASYPGYPLPAVQYVLGITSAGVADNSFANGGILTTAAHSVVVQTDGRIITGGSYTAVDNSDILLSRFFPDGSPDNSFGVNGTFIHTISGNDDGTVKLVLKSNDLYLAGNTMGYSNSAFISAYSLGAPNARIVEESVTDISPLPAVLKITPNPSAGAFRLITNSDISNQPISIKISNVLGQLVEEKKASPGESMKFGEKYQPGVYFAEIRQGNDQKIIRLVKL